MNNYAHFDSPLRSRGFNLLELMTAVTILGVLLGVGVPAFTEIVRNNRLASEVNGFVTALNVARSEAYKRGLRVTMCPSNSDQNDCNGSDWGQGWIAFLDSDGNGAVDDADTEILQVWPATSGGFTYATTPAAATTVGFLPMGAAGALTFEVYKSGCTGDKKRQIRVEPTGRISLTKQNC